MIINIAGYDVIIDDEDFERVSAINWRLISNVYFGIGKRINGKYKIIRLHRFIIDAPEGYEVDHVNCNTLDNRKTNLRLCTRTQNSRNRLKNKNNSSGYKGVTRDRNRWRAMIIAENKRVVLGIYETKEEAYKAYCEASKKFHGEFGRIS